MLDNEFRLKQKIEKFKEAFPLAYIDSQLDIDMKHKEIIRELGNQLTWMENLTYKNLRNWKLQSDMDAPATISSVFKNSFVNTHYSLKSIYTLFFRRQQNLKLKESLEDDIAIIEQMGGFDLLQSNPVNLTPGHTPYITKRGVSYNTRWLRYIYLANQIRKNNLLSSGDCWVDVGSYYGGLQSIVKRWNFDISIVLVDFHHQLLRSYIFLSDIFPQAVHNLGINGSINVITPGTITYVPVNQYSELSQLSPSLFTNFFSFGEMHRKDFLAYKKSSTFESSKIIYTVNRFVSAPFFEPIYDSDLEIWDYQLSSHSKVYFDVFPIHHYHVIKRKLFGVQRYRNAGSPYFELILRQNS